MTITVALTCILDSLGNKVLHQKIDADPDALLELLTHYQDNIVVDVECMHCWYWVSDLCLDYAFDFILGHALYIKAIHGGKAKNGRIDSYKIASLLRGGNFPIAYVYPKAMRVTRDLLRRRTKIMRHGADLKAHVSNTFSQYNFHPPNVQLRYPCDREQVRNWFDDPAINHNIDMDFIAFYTKESASVKRLLNRQPNNITLKIIISSKPSLAQDVF